MKPKSTATYSYEFDGYTSYTSHRNITAEEERGIAKAQQPLPYWIVLPDGTKLDWRDEVKFSEEKRTRAGYAIIQDGQIRIKHDRSPSPDYDKPNGHGSCSHSLKIRSKIPLEFLWQTEHD